MGTRELTWRRLAVLIRYLPPGSALHRAMFPDQVDWDVNSYLLAAVVDELANANWMFASAHTEKGKPRPKQPAPFYRPSQPQPATPPRRKSFEQRVIEWKARHCGHDEGGDA